MPAGPGRERDAPSLLCKRSRALGRTGIERHGVKGRIQEGENSRRGEFVKGMIRERENSRRGEFEKQRVQRTLVYGPTRVEKVT